MKTQRIMSWQCLLSLFFQLLSLQLHLDIFSCILFDWFNPLWPSDILWRHRSPSTLAQTMARCLTAPSHYLKQYWLIINMALWHSPEDRVPLDMFVISITKFCMRIKYLKWHPHLPGDNELTHWGRVTHICVSKITIIGSDNGLSPGQCWNIVIWTKFQWKFYRNSYIFIQENAFENVIWKMADILCRPQCVKVVQ